MPFCDNFYFWGTCYIVFWYSLVHFFGKIIWAHMLLEKNVVSRDKIRCLVFVLKEENYSLESKEIKTKYLLCQEWIFFQNAFPPRKQCSLAVALTSESNHQSTQLLTKVCWVIYKQNSIWFSISSWTQWMCEISSKFILFQHSCWERHQIKVLSQMGLYMFSSGISNEKLGD